MHVLRRGASSAWVLVLVIVFGTSAARGVEVDQAWNIFYNGPGGHDDNANLVAVAADGGVFVAGRTYTAFEFDRPFVSQYAESGDERWSRVLPIQIHHESPRDLLADTSGDLLLSAPTRSGVEWALAIWKLAAGDGRVLWDHQVIELGNCLSHPFSDAPIAVGPDDSVHVGGCAMTTIKYAPDGTELWRRAHGTDPQWTMSSDLAVDADGNVFAVGVTIDDVSGFPVAAYDAAGTPLWDDFLVGPIGSILGRAWVELDLNGNVVVAAVPETTCGLFGLMLTKYDTAGNRQWSISYPDNPCTSFAPVGVETLPNGSIAVAGSLGSSADIHVVAFDAAGEFLWSDSHNGPLSSSDVAFDVTSDAAGNIYTVGEEMLASQNRDFFTFSHDSSGNRRWEISFAGPFGGNDRPQSIAVNDCGRVYVSGYGWNPPNNDDGIIIHYTQVEPGDFDRNGQVDLADYAILLIHFGETDASADEGDLDGDGDVDLDDFVIMEAQFHGPCS